MNKIFLFLIFSFFICSQSYAADYVVKHRNSDGEILAWGPMFDLKASPGETIIETDQKIDDISAYVVKNKKVREKTNAEKQADKDLKDQLKAQKKARKQSVLTKMGLDTSDLSALIELIKDENLD